MTLTAKRAWVKRCAVQAASYLARPAVRYLPLTYQNGASGFHAHARYANADALVQPLLEQFTAIGLAIPQATSIEHREQCTASMTHIVPMTTAVSKGVIKPSHPVASQCTTIFEQGLANFKQVRLRHRLCSPRHRHRLRCAVGTGRAKKAGRPYWRCCIVGRRRVRSPSCPNLAGWAP